MRVLSVVLLFAVAVLAFGVENFTKGLKYTSYYNDYEVSYGVARGKNVVNVVIPEKYNDITIMRIGESGFSDSSIVSITMPHTITFISTKAFQNCSELAIVNLSTNLMYIESSAFYGTSSLTNIDLPETIISIGESAFSYSGLKKIKIPPSVEEINDFTFSYCFNLKFVELQEGIKIIGLHAFRFCPIEQIIIPSTLKRFGKAPFYECDKLKVIIMKPVNPPEFDEVLFASNPNIDEIRVPRESLDAYKKAEGWSDYADFIIPIK